MLDFLYTKEGLIPYIAQGYELRNPYFERTLGTKSYLFFLNLPCKSFTT